MKINSFKINGFGKLVSKEVKLSDNINIVYGDNEAGKSSMEKFIDCMFFGAQKIKNGQEISDFEKFTPWKTEEYSGKLTYTLDDGSSYEVFREFKKKNPIIYDSSKKDITKNFSVNKTKGINFLQEQTGIDDETFKNTAISEQEGLKLSKSSQNIIIQKISNLVSSGDDNISYKKSIDRLKARQNEEVGTERTSQKPINMVESRLKRLKDEKKTLDAYKENIFSSQMEKNDIKEEIKKEEEVKKLIKDIKNVLEENRLKNVEIKANKQLEDEYSQKIDELNDKIEDNEISEEYEKTSFKSYYILIAVLIAIFIGWMIWKPGFVNIIALFPVIPLIILLIRAKEKARAEKKSREYGRMRITNELDFLSKNRDYQRSQYEEKREELHKELEKEKEGIVAKYIGKIDASDIDEYMNKSLDEINKELDLKDNRINSIKFRLQTLEGRTREINNKVEELSEIEEEIDRVEEEKEELLSLNNSYNIARKCMEDAYEEVKNSISPKFINNLCKIISKISNGRYQKVALNDKEGLSVEIENGKYVPASRLSVGTIDQMYLSLRLGSLNEISRETMPIILDEAFAYFDDNRLANVLNYLNTEFKNNQIIIFTCGKREKEILDEINIDYNYVEI